jgi:long-chain fatty acid transport protein
LTNKLHSTLVLAGFAVLAYGSALATTGPVQTGLFATADNAVSANINPAGLSRIKERELVFQGLYFDSTSNFEYTTDKQAKSQTIDSGGSTTVPLIYFATPLTDKIGAGAFVTGNAISEDFSNTGASSYLVTSYNLVTAQLQGNLSYQIMDKLAIGGGLSVNYTSFEYKSNVLNLEPIGPGEMKLESSDVTVSYVLGLLYEFTPQTRLGLVYHSQINPSLSDTPQFSNLGPGRQAQVDSGLGVFNQNVTMNLKIPQIIAGGIFHEFDNGDTTELDVGWVEASDFGFTEISFGDTELNRQGQNLQNIWLASLGYAHQLNPEWKVSAGFLYVSSAVSDKNRTFIFKPDSLWGVGFGGEYKASKDHIYGLNLNYYALGPADTEAYVSQIDETISGKYTEHYAIGLDFTFRWTGL